MLKRIYLCFIAVMMALIGAIVAVAICTVGQDQPPRAIGELPDGAQTVEGFFLALREGDSAALDECVYGYSTLGMDKPPENTYGERLLGMLRESYQYSLIGEPVVAGKEAAQTVSVSYLSVPAASEQIKARTLALYEERMSAARSNDELFDENGALLETVAYELYEQAFAETLADPSAFVVETTLEVRLEYCEGTWLIVLDDALTSVILGDVNRL